jgi:hypothetical protein
MLRLIMTTRRSARSWDKQAAPYWCRAHYYWHV